MKDRKVGRSCVFGCQPAGMSATMRAKVDRQKALKKEEAERAQTEREVARREKEKERERLKQLETGTAGESILLLNVYI